MKKILLTLALIVFSLTMTLPFASASAAEAVTDPSADVDALFVQFGADLYTVDADFNVVKASKTQYLAEFDDNGELIKSGFKLVEVGDDIGYKTLYIYNQEATSTFEIGLNTGTTIINYSSFGYHDNAVFKGATSISSGNSFYKLKYEKTPEAIVTRTSYANKAASPEIYALAYIYYELPEATASNVEQTFGDKVSDWMADNLGLNVSSTAALIILAGLAIMLLRK